MSLMPRMSINSDENPLEDMEALVNGLRETAAIRYLYPRGDGAREGANAHKKKGLCNIKKFIKDTANKQIVLLSESSQELPPIYIHPEEVEYFVLGKVVQVIKRPTSIAK